MTRPTWNLGSRTNYLFNTQTMTKSYIYGKVDENGKLQLIEAEKSRMLKAVAMHRGKDVVITVERRSTTKSQRQNGYYHSVVKPFAMHVLRGKGYYLDEDETHNFLVQNFMPSRPIQLVHDVSPLNQLKAPKSYSEANAADVAEFIENIARFLAMLDAELPMPKPNIE